MEKHEIKHIETLRALAPECTVLLKKNGDFPLSSPCKIALFGSGARKTLKGGTGSGDVNSRFFVTAEQGLINAGFEVTGDKWRDEYDITDAAARKRFIKDLTAEALKARINPIVYGMGAVMPEPDYSIPLEGEGDTCIYVLSRICGEGNDRKDIKGDFRLTESEVRDILACRENYKKFMLVLNVGSVVDLSPVMSVENILVLGQLGVVTGDVLADILLGKAYPSGKLTTTWAGAEGYPNAGSFGENNETSYNENIYVGYRWFDTLNKSVYFPFGYGIGYTDFNISYVSAQKSGRFVEITAKVENIGSFPGKETVQLYASIPNGRLDHPTRQLCGFAKTNELMPGEKELVSITLDTTRLASYDTENTVYFMEKGEYILSLGSSSRDNIPVVKLVLEEEIITKKLSNVGGNPEIVEFVPSNPAVVEVISPVDIILLYAADYAGIKEKSPAKPCAKAREFVKFLEDSDLINLCIGAYKKGADSITGAAGSIVAGAAGETFGKIAGVPALSLADGPAGLRLSQMYTKDEKGVHPVGMKMPMDITEYFPPVVGKIADKFNEKKSLGEVSYQYCTAIPIGTDIAQSWNIKLAESCGELVADEMELYNVDVWLAPALNIHRSPLCGRNFEYYSEDPLISGMFAAAITRGVQSRKGRYVTIKHYCCNNQEQNRMQNNSLVPERALREIYLEGFRICMEESNPGCIMTSYNLLNGEHTSQREDIIKTVLREEWGWDGVVMTDWVIAAATNSRAKYPRARVAPTVKAGNNLFMPGCAKDADELADALKGKGEWSVTRQELEENAAWILNLIFRNA